jgi:hypothetical protein
LLRRSTRALARDDHEQIVNKWREVRTPLPANASVQRKDVIRGYRRELSKLGLLNAKTEADVRNRLVDREGERPRASEPETIERTGAAPPGAPPPTATRTADPTEPRPQDGVFDSKGGARRMPMRVRDKPVESNQLRRPLQVRGAINGRRSVTTTRSSNPQP